MSPCFVQKTTQRHNSVHYHGGIIRACWGILRGEGYEFFSALLACIETFSGFLMTKCVWTSDWHDIVDLFQSLRARALQSWLYIPSPRIRVVLATLVHSFLMSREFYAGKATNFLMLFMHSMWRFLSFSWQNEGERPFVKVDIVQSLRARALQTLGYNPTSRIRSAALRNPAKTNKTFWRRSWSHENYYGLKMLQIRLNTFSIFLWHCTDRLLHLSPCFPQKTTQRHDSVHYHGGVIQAGWGILRGEGYEFFSAL